MNFKIALASAIALVAPAAFAQNAQQILEGARVSATLTQVEDGLNGKLNGKTPIVLYLKGKEIQFQFNENNIWQTFHMRLSDNSYDLFEMKDKKTFKFPDAKITQSIAGTDLTYEDLALRFFYWPNPILEGQEQIGGRAAYKLRVNKPKGTAGRYDTVYIWVDAKFGAFMQIRGFNNSKLLKEFKVEDVMEIGGGVWTLKKMQVSSYDGDAGKERRTSVTTVTFDTPKKAGPRGLRK
jgi:hypothetical protein